MDSTRWECFLVTGSDVWVLPVHRIMDARRAGRSFFIAPRNPGQGGPANRDRSRSPVGREPEEEEEPTLEDEIETLTTRVDTLDLEENPEKKTIIWSRPQMSEKKERLETLKRNSPGLYKLYRAIGTIKEVKDVVRGGPKPTVRLSPLEQTLKVLKLMSDLVEGLAVRRRTAKVLEEAEMVTKLFPKLISRFASNYENHEPLRSMVGLLLHKITEAEFDNALHLEEAILLDPRFKKIAFKNYSNYKQRYHFYTILEKAARVITTRGKTLEEARESAKTELTEFLKSPTFRDGHDILGWWLRAEADYPNLFRVFMSGYKPIDRLEDPEPPAKKSKV